MFVFKIFPAIRSVSPMFKRKRKTAAHAVDIVLPSDGDKFIEPYFQ